VGVTQVSFEQISPLGHSLLTVQPSHSPALGPVVAQTLERQTGEPSPPSLAVHGPSPLA
jgi:hypothetical protein